MFCLPLAMIGIWVTKAAMKQRFGRCSHGEDTPCKRGKLEKPRIFCSASIGAR